MNICCFYHRVDNDGKFSALAVKTKYPECKLVGVNYEEKFPYGELEGFGKQDQVYIVDFSVPYSELVDLHNKYDFHWIDHHTSSIRDEKENRGKFKGVKIKGLRSLNHAGCHLTWKYLFPANKMPKAVELAGNHDIWKHEDPDVLSFHYGMKIHDLDPKDYENMKKYLKDHGELLNDILDKGRTIREAFNREYKSYVKSYGKVVKFRGLDCLVVNRGSVDSKAFGLAAKDIKHDIRAAYIRGVDGKYSVELSTDKGEEVCCDVIAENYGGGGHHGAAGFRCEDLPFKI